ncbi:hypothetical protein [Streptomyces sp. NPDC101181]|uniref:hypothetical protein n=1 Tax=Streptomyces sp. NPDC101181 TaxID=3366125 RepID=UPI00380E479A
MNGLMAGADWPLMARHLTTFLPNLGRVAAGVEQAVARNTARYNHGGTMNVCFVGGPLAGVVLRTTEDWAGGWFTTEGANSWSLYVPVHREASNGTVLAEERTTAPRAR